MVESQKIYCPICRKKVASYDGKRTYNIIAPCGVCDKEIVFDVNTGETKARKMTPRNTSSGKRFT